MMELLTSRNVVGFLVLIIMIGLGATVVSGMRPTVSTSTDELFTGVAASQFTTAGSVVSISSFSAAAPITAFSADVPIATAIGSANITANAQAEHSGASWGNVNITINVSQGSGDIVTWVAGTCNAANKTLANASNAYYAISSSCLTPGSNVSFKFDNNGTDANVTSIRMVYEYYAPSAAYSLSSGVVTPSANGHYKMTYEYTAENAAVANANTQGQTGILNMSQMIPNIGLILGAGIIVGLLFYLFVRKNE